MITPDTVTAKATGDLRGVEATQVNDRCSIFIIHASNFIRCFFLYFYFFLNYSSSFILFICETLSGGNKNMIKTRWKEIKSTRHILLN